MFNLILRVRIHFQTNTESVSVGDSDTLNEIKQQAYRSCVPIVRTPDARKDTRQILHILDAGGKMLYL